VSKNGPSVLRICPLIVVAGLLAASVAYAGDVVTSGIDLSGTWVVEEWAGPLPVLAPAEWMTRTTPSTSR
jgi:hypothetical protein